MAPKRFGTRIDLQNNEILNMLFQKTNGLPTATATLQGSARFNTADGRFYVCDGTTWNLKATWADSLQGASPAQLRDRGTHTGQQPASTISDLQTVVLGYPVNQHAAANGPLAMGNNRITGLAAGTASNDAVTKAQLDIVANIAANAAAGVAVKEPVIAVASSNISITSPPNPLAIDGVTIPANGRVLLAGQTTASERGIYTVPATGPLVRAQDADQTGELAPGTQVYVTQGVSNADTIWAIVSDAAITIGTTAQNWVKVPGGGGSGSSNTFGPGLEVVSGDVRVKAGLGITVVDGTTAIDRASTTRVCLVTAKDVPSGSTQAVVNHGLGTPDLASVKVREKATGDIVECGTTVTGDNTITLEFAVPPTAGQYRVTVAG